MKIPGQEEEVREFLINERDFFIRNEDLLCLLKLSHPNTKGSVSLLEKQNNLLRKALNDNRNELETLRKTVRYNHETLDKVFEWVLRISFGGLKNGDLAAFLRFTRQIFDLGMISLLLVEELNRSAKSASGEKRAQINTELLNKIKTIKKPVLANSHKELTFWTSFIKSGKYSYVKNLRDTCASIAVLPLRQKKEGQVKGVLILVSAKENRFDESLGTFFLDLMGTVSSRVIFEK